MQKLTDRKADDRIDRSGLSGQAKLVTNGVTENRSSLISNRPASWIGCIYLTLGYLLLYLPLMVMVVYSFNRAEQGIIWRGFTFNWYRQLANNRELMIVAGRSFLLGFSVAGLATMLGTLIATAVFRYRFLGRQALYNMSNVLILTPEIIVAVFLLLLYTMIGMPLGFWSLLMAHVAIGVPFVTITVFSRIMDLDKNLLEAATDLGASDWIIWRYILIPLLWPAIAVGWIMSFTLSLDDLIISYFVGGPGFNTLPIKIYSMARLGIRPEINALCTLLLLLTLAAVTISYRFLKHKNQGDDRI